MKRRAFGLETLLAMLLTICCGLAGSAQAEGASLLTAPRPPAPPAPSASARVGTRAPPSPAASTRPRPQAAYDTARTVERETEKDPMAWLGIGLKIGFARIGASRFKNPTYRAELAQAAAMVDPAKLEMLGITGRGRCSVIDERCSSDSRSGLQIAVPISLGGDGLGFVIEPYFTLADSARAYGVYFGPKFEIHVAEPVYVGFGFGLKSAWVLADGWDYAADLFGRVPVHVTWYAHEDVALIAEFGFAYGTSGYLSLPITYTDPQTGTQVGTSPSMSFSIGSAVDFTLGVRFP